MIELFFVAFLTITPARNIGPYFKLTEACDQKRLERYKDLGAPSVFHVVLKADGYSIEKGSCEYAEPTDGHWNFKPEPIPAIQHFQWQNLSVPTGSTLLNVTPN